MKLNKSNSSLRICVDSVENSQISGRIYGQRLEKALIFVDIGDLLLQIDDVLNAQDYPRAFQRKRSFGPGNKAMLQPPDDINGDFMSQETVESMRGKIATQCVTISTRQNTSWQGSIDWLDGRPPSNFRSALEFIRIISEALKKE